VSEFFPRPCHCPVCGEEVLYREGRRRCSSCRAWCHDRCAVRNGFRFDDRSTCYGCVDRAGCPTLAQLEVLISDLDRSMLDGGLRDSALVVLASLWTGPDEARVAAATGVRPDEVRARAERLREAGTWTADGKVALDAEAFDGPAEYNVVLIINVLVANGEIVRSPAPVPSGDEVRPQRQ
jgi:hypothetical protein